MTPIRATGPGPRFVALPTAAPALLLCVGLAVSAVACGPVSPVSSGPTASGVAQPGSSASVPGSAGSVPGSSGSAPDPSGSAPDPSGVRWPGTTVLAVIALGAADGEIQKAGADLKAAADKQDLKAMWGAADGLARMIDALLPTLDRLDAYEGTKPVAALYRVALPEIGAGAKRLRDAITSGDSAGVVAGSQQIARGLGAYAPIRSQIAALVEQAILQQRLLVK
ncbi:MAG: hypothetical protein H0U52_18575 [Chloroflexi bacterium]|nr:hypothetical protein [Chloroflexota bacterium]